MSTFKNQKSTLICSIRISQRFNQIFEILELYCFAFPALAIDKTFTQRKLFTKKIEIVSMYFALKSYEQMRSKIGEKLRTANFNQKFTGNKKKCN